MSKKKNNNDFLLKIQVSSLKHQLEQLPKLDKLTSNELLRKYVAAHLGTTKKSSFIPEHIKKAFNDLGEWINTQPRIRWELFNTPGVEFTHEEYDEMEGDEAGYPNLPFRYELIRFTHLPEDDSLVKYLKQLVHHDIAALRDRATSLYQEELKFLQGKYAPESPKDYDREKGIGYALALVLHHTRSGKIWIIDSSYTHNQKLQASNRKIEAKIFAQFNKKYPEEFYKNPNSSFVKNKQKQKE